MKDCPHCGRLLEAARINPDDWKKNFIVLGPVYTLAVTVVAAENNGWRAEVGYSKGGMVIESPRQMLTSQWCRSYQEAEAAARSLARKHGVKWVPQPYGDRSKLSASTLPTDGNH